MKISIRGTNRFLLSQFQGKTAVTPFATEHALDAGRGVRADGDL